MTMRLPLLVGVVLLAGALEGSSAWASSPAPEVFTTVRQAPEGRVLQGEPLRIAVRLEAPRGATISLAPTTGTWVDAVFVELFDATGKRVLARAEVQGKPDDGVATLSGVRHAELDAGGLWRFAPQALATLTPGPYVVRARLTIDSGTGWKGTVAGRDEHVTLISPTDQSVTEEDRVLTRARSNFLDGQLEPAADALDQWLLATPRAGDEALILRARIAERMGEEGIARLCAQVAARRETGPLRGEGPSPAFEILRRLEGRLDGSDPNLATEVMRVRQWPPSAKLMAELLSSDRARAPGPDPSSTPKPSSRQ
jgi:hypothetical protein